MLITELFELAKGEGAGTLFVVFDKAVASSATEPHCHRVHYDWGSLRSVGASRTAVVAVFLKGP